jgi:hypothetical protein
MVWVASVNATGVAEINLPKLCDDADFVVSGQLMRQQSLGETTHDTTKAALMLAHVRVERVFKGRLEGATLPFRFVLPYAGIGYRGFTDGQVGIFFLRWKEGEYHVLDPYYPSVPSVPLAPHEPLVEGTCVDRVTYALGRVFASKHPSVESRWTRWEAVRALESVQTPQATAALRTAAEDKDPLVRVWAMSALLSRNDLSMLDRVEKLPPIPPDPHVENLTARLRSGLERVRDPRAIPALARLLRSTDVNLRGGAVGAFRGMKDPAAIQPLATALNDPDDQIVWDAIMGLVEISGDLDHGPGPQEDFKGKQREEYVSYWRNWAQAQKQPSE